MDWIEIIVHTTTPAADVVSQKLIDEGATGTMVEDRADIPDPTKPNGIWEIIDPKLIDTMPEDVLVHAWFAPDEHLSDHLQGLRDQFTEMKSLVTDFDTGSLAIETVNVKDEDWNEVWKRFYKPFRAGKRLVVKPTWEPYERQEGDLVMEIDPGMAFGSGTHETTAMCLEILEQVLKPGDRVMDVGTGSGILAIGAALLGASEVWAGDIDPTAVRVARDNVAQNSLSDRISTMCGNLLDGVQGTCEVCVANIIADIIIMFADPLNEHVIPGGLFICSGIIKEREQEVTKALLDAHYSILEIHRRGEWVAILSRRHD